MILKPFYENPLVEAGIDEAGRGCLAGPVTAAAVMLDEKQPISGLNDSKKLSPEEREELQKEIMAKSRAWRVAFVDARVIEEVNILQATFQAMHQAVLGLSVKPKMLLVDGNRFNPLEDYDHQCIIKGDSLYQSIAAASILAKVARDEHMLKLHEEYPDYHWEKNKGYPTPAHRKAVMKLGPSPYHRNNFQLIHRRLGRH